MERSIYLKNRIFFIVSIWSNQWILHLAWEGKDFGEIASEKVAVIEVSYPVFFLSKRMLLYSLCPFCCYFPALFLHCHYCSEFHVVWKYLYSSNYFSSIRSFVHCVSGSLYKIFHGLKDTNSLRGQKQGEGKTFKPECRWNSRVLSGAR